MTEAEIRALVLRQERLVLAKIAGGESGPEARRALRALRVLSGDVRPARSAPSQARTSAPKAQVATPTLAEIEAKIAKLEAETPVGKLLATRPDLSPAVVSGLRMMPLDVVRQFLDGHPVGRAAPTVHGLSDASVGVGGRAASAFDSEAMRQQMGLPPTTPRPISTFNGAVQALPSLTREEAQALHEARTKGSV